MKLTGTSSLDISLTSLDSRAAEAALGKTADIEVTVISGGASLSNADLREVWNHRSNRGSRKVVVAFTTGENTTLFGPASDRQPLTLKTQTAERLLQRFLDEPSILDASRELISFYDSHGTSELGGVKNKGLFASHHLRENLPQRRDWAELTKRGDSLAKLRHRELVAALGFEIDSEERNALVLKTGSAEKRVIAILLEDSEKFDASSARFPSSPVSWGLSIAADHNVPWLIVMRKDQIRLHPGKDGVGVGQKGQVETYFELNLAQVAEQNIALLPLIFSAASLADKGEVQKLLEESSKFAASLGARLRERVYDQVVPPISIAVAKKLQARGEALDSAGLQRAYSMTLKILFRLLFQAYAEDRGLLPAGRNEGYDANSLKELGKRHMNTPAEEFGESASIWFDLVQVWDAIDVGNKSWNVPAYNGGLFGSDPEKHPEGAAIKYLELPDSVLGPALQGLLVDNTEDGVRGPVDFRSLSVREFGTIYEGLLESSLSLAEVDLTVDKSNAWVPAESGDEVLAKAGEPYFHSASGERKATGSYFTPKFVVDHLVQKAIDPTIDVHLEKIAALLRSGDTATAGREFFDFRVADLAMGSAHFLVAAVDRIEAKMRSFLAEPGNAVPALTDELARLRQAATEALGGDEIAIAEIEDFALLRRQIARRCIYGVDINYMAVELARLAIWIHTFVPGLPMSSLNHNLVHGSSLTGLSSIQDALDVVAPSRNSQASFFDFELVPVVENAARLLVDAATEIEATTSGSSRAARLQSEAQQKLDGLQPIFDAAFAARSGMLGEQVFFNAQSLLDFADSPGVTQLLDLYKPIHFPLAFPEVFMRPQGGFDCLVGNPPWEKAHVDEPSWWALHAPSTRGLKGEPLQDEIANVCSTNPTLRPLFDQAKRVADGLRQIFLSLGYEGLGKAHLDLFQLFAWRNWELLANYGSLALVLPRNAMSGPSLEAWRRQVLEFGSFDRVLFAKNQNGWLFPNIAANLTIALVAARKEPSASLKLGPMLYSKKDLHDSDAQLVTLATRQFLNWSTSASFPTLESEHAIDIYQHMSLQPTVDSWTKRIRPVSEFNSTTDSKIIKSFSGEGEPAHVLAGGSFNLWNPDSGAPFALGNLDSLTSTLEEKLTRQIRSKATAFYGFDLTKLHPRPWQKPRIMFRDVSRSSDPRTGIFCLVPANCFSVEGSPYLFIENGSAFDEAFVLGVMSSIPFDWLLRQWVELHLKFYILNKMPLPAPDRSANWSRQIADRAGRLAAIDDRYATWASELGVAYGSVQSEVDRAEVIYELDALVCLMYGLNEDQVKYIYGSFRRGWDYQPRLERVLEYYAKWKDQADA